MQWRVFYGDGRTFSSEDGHPHASPGRYALVIVQRDELVGRVLIHGFDWYVLDADDQWHGCPDRADVDEYMLDLPARMVRVVKGFGVPDPTFAATLQRAKNDPDFPPKSATRASERPINRSCAPKVES